MANNKKKTELSKNDLRILIIVVCVLISIFGSFATNQYWFNKQREKLAEDNQTLTDLQVKLDEAKRVPALIADYQNKINLLVSGTDENGDQDKRLKLQIDVPDVLTTLETSLSSSGIKISQIAMNGNASYVKGGIVSGDSQTTQDANAQSAQNSNTQSTDAQATQSTELESSSYYSLEVELSISDATYQQFLSFLNSCESTKYYICVTDSKLSTGGGGAPDATGQVPQTASSKFSGTITLTIYSFEKNNK